MTYKTGLLNNTKWHKLFALINDLNMNFVLKQLNDQNEIYCDFIRELEKDRLIIDEKIGFIKFFDIEEIILKPNAEVLAFLRKKEYSFEANYESIKVHGYL